MNEPMNSGEFQAHTEQIERLVQRVSGLADEDARTSGLELMQCLMDLHGAALSRMVEILGGSGDAGHNALAKLGGDPLLCGLLVLYGVHPRTLEERVGHAIEKASAQIRKQGGSVELLSLAEGVVRVKIESAGHGCGSSPEKFKLAVEQAILEAAPEVVEVVAETPSAAAFIPVNMIQPASNEEKTYEESTA
jgi:Fe-S cluster biogenesis protein NfuA